MYNYTLFALIVIIKIVILIYMTQLKDLAIVALNILLVSEIPIANLFISFMIRILSIPKYLL